MIVTVCLIIGSIIAMATITIALMSNKFKREFEAKESLDNARSFLKRDQ
jgi:hypothetical protein